MSGGFPHSEIPGSKGALASPGLIAECHVLHRLLSPRHPPNALFALDPIQKTNDALLRGAVQNPNVILGPLSEVVSFPIPRNGRSQIEEPWSVYRLGKTVFGRRAAGRPTRHAPHLEQDPKTSRVSLSSRCQTFGTMRPGKGPNE